MAETQCSADFLPLPMRGSSADCARRGRRDYLRQRCGLEGGEGEYVLALVRSGANRGDRVSETGDLGD